MEILKYILKKTLKKCYKKDINKLYGNKDDRK